MASSPYSKKEHLDIAISLVTHEHSIFEDYKKPSSKKETRYGFTSKYSLSVKETFPFVLNNNEILTTRLVCRESGFKLPTNPTSPLVMICTGTGVAPFISFLQEIEHMRKDNKTRETLLIFGSKNSQADFIYKEEISTFLNKDVLTWCNAVFSRDKVHLSNKNQAKRTDTLSDITSSSQTVKYVQDVLDKDNNKDLIEKILLKEQGSLFVCGGVNMGNDVMKTLENLFGISELKKLEHEKRIFKELWG